MSDDDTENSNTGSSVTEAPSSSPQGGIMGQLDDDIGELESKFNEIACEMGVDYSDLWEEFENDHSASYGL